MLFAISGSQGSGKTTVINALRERGFPIVERKTSRSILEEWGVTLSEVNNDRDLTVKFQDEIISRKQADEQEAVWDVSRIWFTERTYADLFTYALIAIGKDNEYSDWINGYFEHCQMLQSTYAHNFYLPSGVFACEHDGVRGANKYYARMVDVTMRDVLDRMSQPLRDVSNLDSWEPTLLTTAVSGKHVDERVSYILHNISRYIES